MTVMRAMEFVKCHAWVATWLAFILVVALFVLTVMDR